MTRRTFLFTTLLLLGSRLPGALATTQPPTSTSTAASAAPSSASNSPLPGVPTSADIDAAALKVAETLDGVLRNCPAAYAAIGTPGKRCVGAAGDVETVRSRLGAALGADLHGVWRSRDDQRTVFNWIKMPSGTVYLRIASDEAASGRSLVYFDAPTVPAAAMTTQMTIQVTTQTAPQTPAQTTSQATSPSLAARQPTPSKSASTTAAAAFKTPTFQATSPSADGSAPRKSLPAPAAASGPAFSRTLQLAAPRLNGPDVRAAQNRLITLTLGGQGGQGDGWYGPNTAKTVRDFQIANKLKATGSIDRFTWSALFSPNARKFRAAQK